MESLWLGWVVGSFNISNPSIPVNSLGWANVVDGNSVQYGGTSGTALAAGDTATFTLGSKSTPADFQSATAGPSVAYGVNASQFAIENTTTDSREFTPTVVVAAPIPSILQQPLSQTVLTNSTVTFFVTASNATSYQWQSNTVALAGAISSSLTLSSVVVADSASYSVVVSNATGSVTSSNAVLTVVTAFPPVITTQPQNETVLTNSMVTLSVTASDATSFQWASNTVAIAGATNSTLVLSNVVVADSASYSVVVSNSVASVISSNAVLTVVTAFPPVITAQPQNETVPTNSSITLSVTASGAASYQWASNTVAIAGATNSTLVLSNVVVGDSGSYEVTVSNTAGSVTSSTAIVLVGFPASITQQPTNVQVLAGTPVTFQIGAIGSPAPDFQWSLNGAPLMGQTSSTLQLAAATTNLAGTYTVLVSNIFGGLASSNAVLTVLPLATNSKEKLTVTINPGSGSVSPNLNGKLLVVAKNYTVTANPAHGQVFSHWSGIVDSEDKILTFAMPSVSGAVLTANFVPSPFAQNGVAATYSGLFWDTNNLSNETAGFFSATLANSGVLSGQVKLAGTTSTFSTTLHADGSGSVQIKRHGLSMLVLTLQVDLSGSGTMTGTASDDQTFNAQLNAYRPGFSTSNKATDYSGYYTWVMPGSPSNGPAGNSFGTATISGTGGVHLTVSLSDGTSTTASGSISPNGVIPLYVSLYGGKGSLISWLSFNDSAAILFTNGAFWFKNADFALTNLSLLTGAYSAEGAGVNALNASSASVQLSGANLATPISETISLNANGAGTSSNNLTANLSNKSGLFNGSFKDPTSNKTAHFHGAILRATPSAYGYFIANDVSGAIFVQPQ